MRVSRPVPVIALIFLSSLVLPTFVSAQLSDQVIAERILGLGWKQLSRRAGMIFAGTVLTSPAQSEITQTSASQRAAANRISAGPIPAIELSFRVDQPIAGVDRGQILTIHEWAGAWSMHRPMSTGQHVLLFLYPPSRLGLTSPVGGSLGQIVLDGSGKNVVQRKSAAATESTRTNLASSRAHSAGNRAPVSVVQLQRAILSARNEEK